MYNYLNNEPFLKHLSSLIADSRFSPDERKTEVLLEIYSKLLPDIIKLDLSFGFVWIFEEKVVFYFKDDFNFDDFFIFFQNLESAYKLKWGCIEFFDKNIKIIEIFAKKHLLRSFRDSSTILGEKGSMRGVRETFVDYKEGKFLSFLKYYKARNIKLIVYCYYND
jgi:hypothetical protein